MEVVIDTNVIISALIKSGKTREIISKSYFDFITPAYTLSEINKHKDEIFKKAKISQEEFNELLDRLFRHIRILNPKAYSSYLDKANELIKDADDVPFLACALYLNCPIWSDDKHFQKQKAVKVLKTSEFISFIS